MTEAEDRIASALERIADHLERIEDNLDSISLHLLDISVDGIDVDANITTERDRLAYASAATYEAYTHNGKHV